MANEAELLDIVDRVYAAAENAALWPDVLSRLANLLGAGGASLDYYDTRTLNGGVSASTEMHPDAIAAYVEHFAATNILWPRIESAGLLYSGAVVHNRDVIEDSEFARTEYCGDFLEPILGVFHAAGGSIVKSAHVSSNLSILRKRSLPFEPGDLAILRMLMPHFQRSIGLHRRLAAANQKATVAEETIDRISDGVLVLGESSEILFINTAAQRILNERDGLSLAARLLCAADPRETKRLRTLIGEAMRGTNGDLTKSGGMLRITRPSGKRSYSVLVTPLRVIATRVEQPRTVAIFITDPTSVVRADSSTLRDFYGLTPAETGLVRLLLEGLSLTEAATSLDIAVGTARQHLKSIFAKTGTCRQSELLLLLSSTLRTFHGG